MITVITGTPGAGKTLYAISKLLMQLVGTVVKQTQADGTVVEHPRTIYTNIKGLLIDHELVQDDGPEGLRSWHTWAKPGAVIVVDEFQRTWPPRPNGSKIPEEIAALDTHRHMGVDFILICQNLLNADRHIHGLTNRHLHVRRMANMPVAVVYEWDHASRGLLFKNALSKTPFKYSSKVYKLYRSAELHTKQPRSLPFVLWLVLAAVAGLFYLVPQAKDRILRGVELQTVVQAAPDPKKLLPPAPAASRPRPAVLPVTPAPVVPPSPTIDFQLTPVDTRLSGCGSVRDVCRCFNAHGVELPVPRDMCNIRVAPVSPQLAQVVPLERTGLEVRSLDAPDLSLQDAEVLSFLGRGRHRVQSAQIAPVAILRPDLPK